MQSSQYTSLRNVLPSSPPAIITVNKLRMCSDCSAFYDQFCKYLERSKYRSYVSGSKLEAISATSPARAFTPSANKFSQTCLHPTQTPPKIPAFPSTSLSFSLTAALKLSMAPLRTVCSNEPRTLSMELFPASSTSRTVVYCVMRCFLALLCLFEWDLLVGSGTWFDVSAWCEAENRGAG